MAIGAERRKVGDEKKSKKQRGKGESGKQGESV